MMNFQKRNAWLFHQVKKRKRSLLFRRRRVMVGGGRNRRKDGGGREGGTERDRKLWVSFLLCRKYTNKIFSVRNYKYFN